MFDTIRQTVNVPKKDLVSIVAQAEPGTLNGCKWCKKTILFNGGTWVHVNDEPRCSGIYCQPEWTSKEVEVEETVGNWFPSKRKLKAPVSRCKRCGKEATALLISGKWHSLLGGYGSNCEVAVATPIAARQSAEAGT